MSDAVRSAPPESVERLECRPEAAPSFPTLTDEDKVFLRALVDIPEDRTTWLVYADWLEDRGDPRAEFLRLIVDRDLMPRGDPLVALADARLAHLRNELDPLWLAAFDPAPVVNCPGARSDDSCVWTELTATDAPDIRLCYGCRRPVFYCHTLSEAELIGSSGEVIALSTRVPLEQYPRPAPPVDEDIDEIELDRETFMAPDARQARYEPPPARPWWKFW